MAQKFRVLLASHYLISIGLLAAPAVAQDESGAGNEAPPLRLVNLVEVATLEFEPDPERLEDWDSWPGSWTNDFFLVANQQGQPTHCEPFDVDNQSALADRLCADLIQNARVRILDGFSLGGRQGVVALSKQPFTALPGMGLDDAARARSLSLAIVELAPQAFTQYTPARDYENVVTDGLSAKAPETMPTYPSYSLRARHEGSSGIVMEVSEDLEITSCRPIDTSGYARLDNAACRYALANLEFEWKGGRSIEPAPYYYKLRLTWRIPGD